MTAATRVLVLSPVFHGYWRPIAAAFESIGHHVDVCRYDELPTAADKARNKVRLELPRRWGVDTTSALVAQHSDRVIDALRSTRPDLVLVIKGDTFDDRVAQAASEVGARTFLWLYDELRRTRHTDTTLAPYEAVTTYSRLDAAEFARRGLTTLHVANAFDPAATPQPIHGNAVVFVGARYPNRTTALAGLAAAGVPVHAYGRDWSRHPIDRARTMTWWRPAVPSSRDIPRELGYALMAGAPAALNMHHDQDGFTMRTFEASGVGGVQLIDRGDVDEFYEPGIEVAVFTSHDELVELARRAVADDRWGDALRAAAVRRTLAEHTFAHRARRFATLWA